MRVPLLALLATLALVAGCIQPDQPTPAAKAGASSSADAQASMTGEESRKDATMPCLEGVGINGATLPGAFCAVRTITVSGTISGIAELPVDLATFTGPITVKESSEGSWSLVATLTARGTTPDDATASLASVWFTWDHLDAGAHRIHALAKVNGSNDGGYAATLALAVPPSVTMRLAASDGSGGITVEGGNTDGLALSTGSGSISVKTSATDATLHTGSGSIDATLTPSAEGTLEASTGSGKVALRLPEDAGHGYALTASTGSGSIDIGLKDGDATACPQHGPCSQREFHTRGFASRDVRSTVAISTGSGDVTVRSA